MSSPALDEFDHRQGDEEGEEVRGRIGDSRSRRETRARFRPRAWEPMDAHATSSFTSTPSIASRCSASVTQSRCWLHTGAVVHVPQYPQR